MNCISIDWLQLHVKIRVEHFLQADFSPSGAFGILKKDIRSNVFKEHRELLSNLTGEWEACATLSFSPLSGILPHDSAHIKILNKYLYHSDLNRLVWYLLHDFKFQFVNVSRFDIAADFYGFFRKLSVPKFFKGVLEKKILKRMSCSIAIEGFASKSMPIHYMRFGSKNSPVQFYIYNKSKELRDKTDKPWIRQKWELHGLHPDSADIWRMEFVLHPSKFGVVDCDNGEAIDFTNLEVLEESFLRRLFVSLLNRYAVFVINDGQVRKERMKQLQLFNLKENVQSVFVRISEKQSSNRMDKVFIKKLYLLNQEWRNHNKDDPPVTDLLQEFIDRKDLQKWFAEKMITNPQNTLQNVTSL